MFCTIVQKSQERFASQCTGSWPSRLLQIDHPGRIDPGWEETGDQRTPKPIALTPTGRLADEPAVDRIRQHLRVSRQGIRQAYVPRVAVTP